MKDPVSIMMCPKAQNRRHEIRRIVEPFLKANGGTCIWVLNYNTMVTLLW